MELPRVWVALTQALIGAMVSLAQLRASGFDEALRPVGDAVIRVEGLLQYLPIGRNKS
jgi:hypothetical protein